MNWKTRLVFVFGGLLLPVFAYATNGYFVHGYGTTNKGLAGAGVAYPQDAITAGTNPAGMVHLGKRFDLGAAFFSPRRDYESSSSLAMGGGGAFTVGPNDLSSSRELFIIPHFGYNHPLDANSSVGISIYGNGGLNTVWHGGTASLDPDGMPPFAPSTLAGTFGDSTVSSDLSQAFFTVTYARKLNESLSYGVAPVFAVQSFKVNGLGNFAGFTEAVNRGGMADNLTDNGRDFSYGAGLKVGVLWDLVPGITFGGSYQSRIWMTEFDDYEQLFAERGDFDIPPTATIGFAFKPTEKLTFVVDFQKIWYSEIDSLGNPIANLFACPAVGGPDIESCLGGSNGAGFGWDDMEVYKFGVEYQASPTLVLRAGFSVTEQPIDSTEVLFNILAPAVVEEQYTLGFTKALSADSELTMAFMYAPTDDVEGANAFDPTQTIELEMEQYELEISYAKRF